MDVDVDGFAVMAADAASDVGISYASKSESESELILSPSPVATFNSHVSMPGEPSSMLSLDLTSSTWALALEEDASADAAAADGLPMIPKRRRNAGGRPCCAVNTFTSNRRRHHWSSSSFVEHLAIAFGAGE